MADEDITLDGKPLQSLRVADLKAALEQRSLPKSGQKNTLLKRLKGVSFRSCYRRLSSLAKFTRRRETVGVNVRGRNGVWAWKREYINRLAPVITNQQQFLFSDICNGPYNATVRRPTSDLIRNYT